MKLMRGDMMNALPYVWCVGIGTAVYQNEFKKAYDSRIQSYSVVMLSTTL